MLQLNKRFNKANVRPLLNGTTNLPSYILSKEKFKELNIIATQTNEKSTISHIAITKINFDETLKSAKEALFEKPLNKNILEEFINNQELSLWCETGIKLHKEDEHCKFCGNEIKPERWEALNSHFNDEYDKLASHIGDLLRDVSYEKLDFNLHQYTDENFYDQFKTKFNEIKNSLSTQIKAHNKEVEKLEKLLSAKLHNLFNTNFEINIVNNLNAINELIIEFNKLIDSNNEISKNFSNNKSKAINDLTLHHVAEFEKQHNYKKELANVEKRENKINTFNGKITSNNNRIIEIDSIISEEVKGAEKINELLKTYFRKNDISVRVRDDKKYQLVRKGEVAKNLSEGEKTAICFSYFIARLYQNQANLENTVVFIDDPISSLDANHLFNTYSMIRGTFWDFVPNPDAPNRNMHVCLCRQLFISTHNYDFFHILNDWIGGTKVIDHSKYYIKREINSNGEFSEIIDCPLSITKYNSEYTFLYSEISKYLENPSDNFEIHYNIGNMLRKFTEIYLKNKFVSLARIDDKLSELITDKIECEKARKFMHFNSHFLNRTQPTPAFSATETKNIVESLLNAIKQQDPIHHNALLELTNNM